MLLQVERVASFYGDFQALFDVSVQVAERETVAIIGANGAGKSTLLKTVAGLIARTTGTVAFDGRPLDGMPTHRRLGLGIAMVPEGRRIFPSLTVEENLQVGAHRLRPGPWSVRRVLELFPALAGNGATVVLVEQDIGQALRAADRAYCLLEGRVALHGPSEGLTRQQITDAYFGMRSA